MENGNSANILQVLISLTATIKNFKNTSQTDCYRIFFKVIDSRDWKICKVKL